MPDLNHKFQAGKMNKDLDERLVPNGEYRHAMNVEVATSDDSNMGSLQNIIGNLDISSQSFLDPNGDFIGQAALDTYGFYCVGSIVDKKNDKLYWLVSGIGVDFIAEYDYTTKTVSPIIVDVFQANLLPGDTERVLHFDKSFLITGINIVEETLFWTDNNTEPKRVNIPQTRIGTTDFFTHTQFWVPNPDKSNSNHIPYVAVGDVKHEHITVIKKSPQTPPTIRMKNTTRGDINTSTSGANIVGIYGSGPEIGEVTTTLTMDTVLNPGLLGSWFISATGSTLTTISGITKTVVFDGDPDFKPNDELTIEAVSSSGSLKKTKLIVKIVNSGPTGGLDFDTNPGQLTCDIQIISWDKDVDVSDTSFYVSLNQKEPLFPLNFPRFAYRYKYKDGEYSTFSPFSEIAFLPDKFDWLPKEGYNLGMVNTVRNLGICDFVDENFIPDDVVSIDILYKEVDSTSIYSIRTIKRVSPAYDENSPPNPIFESWNAISPSILRRTSGSFVNRTYGYLDVTSEIIHSIIPSNQFLRSWDAVPRKALAQEVIGNRLVYANYLQNYNLSSSQQQKPPGLYNPNDVLANRLPPQKNIKVELNLHLGSKDITNKLPSEQLDGLKMWSYQSAKTIKSLRTYQLGVIYIDEYGRETPVFSLAENTLNSVTVDKKNAAQQNKLFGHILNPYPDFAKSFKFLIKETASEYYNLAMDRWYNAEDGNIWLSFPSSDRNKVDIETYLILKKAHNSNTAIGDLAKYKILDIENNAPIFIKTKNTPLRTITDGTTSTGAPILMAGGTSDSNYPFTGGTFVLIEESYFNDVVRILEQEKNPTPFFFRILSTEGASKWYGIRSYEKTLAGQYWKVTASEAFGDDMAITTPFNTSISAGAPAYGGNKIEIIRREEKDLPEFEGRFFVKILKDSLLQAAIIGYVSPTSVMTVSSSIVSQYINPLHKTAAKLQEYDSKANPSTWYGCNHKLISIDNNNADCTTLTSMPNGEGQEYWKLAGNTQDLNSDSSGWFIDHIEAFRAVRHNHFLGNQAYNFSRLDAEFNSYAFNSDIGEIFGSPNGSVSGYSGPLMNGSYEANYQQGTQTYSYKFGPLNNTWGLVNALSNNSLIHFTNGVHNLGAYQWQGWSNPTLTPQSLQDFADIKDEIYLKGPDGKVANYMQLMGDVTNRSNKSSGPSGGQGTRTDDYLGFTNVRPPMHKPASNGLSKLSYIPDIDGGHVMSGKGATVRDGSGLRYDNHNIITLSYAGMGRVNAGFESFTTDKVNSLESYFDSLSWAGTYANEQSFIDYITTPGTIWRWKEDPGQVIYQTQNGPPTTGTNPPSLNVWSASQYDALRSDGAGVEFWNYAILSDYLTAHVVRHLIGEVWNGGNLQDPLVPNFASQGVGNYTSGFTKPGGWWSADYQKIAQDIVFSENKAFPRQCIGGYIGDEHEGTQAPTTNPVPFGGRYPTFTGDWNVAANKRRRFQIHAKVLAGQDIGGGASTTGSEGVGGVAPHYYSPANDSGLAPHFDNTGTVLTTVPNTVAPGIRPDGMYTGRQMVPSGGTYYTLKDADDNDVVYEKIPGLKMTDGTNITPAPGTVTWQVLDNYTLDGADQGYFSDNPGIWETEPKDNTGLEVYHEVGQIYPVELNESTIEQFVGPVHSMLANAGAGGSIPWQNVRNSSVRCYTPGVWGSTVLNTNAQNPAQYGAQNTDIRIYDYSVSGSGKVFVKLCDVNKFILDGNATQTVPSIGDVLTFTRANGGSTQAAIKDISQMPSIELETNVHNNFVGLPWFNAYSFGNGVESNRIRDDYNQIIIDNGPKVSAVTEQPYIEERRFSGFIWSGIFNSNNGINNLNQFISAEKITKDLNPIYGSIQKLFARNTDLVTLCEDKVFKVLANKDALFNADGDINLTATQNVLGQTVPFSGDYGISKNPESFAADAYRLYFADRTRGNVLRLSQDGITSISDYGMSDWFADNLPSSSRAIGSFDDKKGEYNINLSYVNYDSYQVGIKGSTQPMIGGGFSPMTPENVLIASSNSANNIHVGDTIVGPGIPIGTTVFAKNWTGGDEWEITISSFPGTPNSDISILGDPIPWGTSQAGGVNIVIWQTQIYSFKDDKASQTLSYSEQSRGWPSFKSFYPESGLSLNNEYFTFKGGQLYHHHINDNHNEFYGEHTESSVEVLFNEEPGSVKSFQTLDYEGTQSKITSDGGLNETSNSGEYWDNYDKLGWYVDHMYTDLQEAKPAEFKNKEGKWFSTVQGITTEWLDDGKAGNIDTKEFSYQGIDETSAITVIDDGGYTSWDCQPAQESPPNCCQYTDSNGNVLDKPLHPQIFDMGGAGLFSTSTSGYSFIEFMFNDPSLLFNNYNYEVTNVTDSWGNLVTASASFSVCMASGGGITDPSAYPNSPTSFLVNDQIYINWASETDDYYTTTSNNGANTIHNVDVTNINYLVQWCIDHIDSTAFFLGMDYNTWQSALQGSGFMYAGAFVNVLAGPCSLMNQSSSSSSHICVEVPGLKTGSYASEAACLADTNSECDTTCANDGTIIVNKWDAFSETCFNGKVAIEFFMTPAASSWTVEYFDFATGANLSSQTQIFNDPNVYTQNGVSQQIVPVPEGQYFVVVTDDLGCEVKQNFEIKCIISDPCPQTNPHTFSAPITQDPAWVTNDCWKFNMPNLTTNSGSIGITNIALAGSTTGWACNLYHVVSGTSTQIDSSNYQAALTGVNFDGLEAGDYQLEIYDTDECIYPRQNVTLNCGGNPCDAPMFGRADTSKTKSTSTDLCVTDNSDGTHTVNSILYPGSNPSYYISYYSYDNSLYSAFPGIGNATQIQAPTGPFTSASPPLPPITGLPASSISGNNYAVVAANTASFSCLGISEFTIECDPMTPVDPCASESSIPVVTHATIHASSYICDNPLGNIYLNLGSHTLQTVTIQPSAQGFTVQYFATNGFNTTAGYSNWIDLTGVLQSVIPGTTMIQANGSTGLTPGDYACEIVDNLGCRKIIFFTVLCETEPVVDPSWECTSNNGPCVQTNSPPDNITIFASQGACNNACPNICLPGVPTWVGCCDNTHTPPYPGFGNQGPNQNPSNPLQNLNCFEDPCCDCCESSLVPWMMAGPTSACQSVTQYSTPNTICGTPTSCFTENDLVEMFDGTMKAISKVEVGDEVRSNKNGEIVKGIVTQALIHPFNGVEEVIKINNITAEPYHPVYIDGKWIPIKELGEVTYQLIDNWYNLEIDGDINDSEHNYIIGGLIASGLGDNERLNNKYQRQPKEIFNL